ncbi:DNAJC17 [Acanthosepion pharaonis]|uniref:DNAJC17 n=1 Tax=Acanthosepion pharaonis TaxID=158019 RepID=A0A812AMQ2_ACAPH|nr:DNAJC17 [Sepia pharaonis]
MPSSNDITKLDLYALLEVTDNATKKEIVSAYRKKALKCHPDKNPDNANAAVEFQQLSSALQILTDVAAKAAYDKVWKAKKAAKVRHKELDSKRKKLKEDLEAREKAYDEKKSKEELSQKDLQAEIERLQKEGSRLLEQEQQLLKEQMRKEHQETSTAQSVPGALPRLKIKWKAAKGDKTNGGYSLEILEKIFSAYGEVTALVVSSKKNGSAIVEFPTTTIAQKVLLCEHGHEENPLTFSWIDAATGPKVTPPPVPSKWDNDDEDDNFLIHKTPTQFGQQTYMYQPMTAQERDYESLVLRKLRQAEERKRLTEQIMKEDQESA